MQQNIRMAPVSSAPMTSMDRLTGRPATDRAARFMRAVPPRGSVVFQNDSERWRRNAASESRSWTRVQRIASSAAAIATSLAIPRNRGGKLLDSVSYGRHQKAMWLQGMRRLATQMRESSDGVAGQVIVRPRTTPLWAIKATNLLLASATVCLVRYMSVYYTALGLSRAMMGKLLLLLPLVQFAGQLFWSAVVDRTGDYKTTLIGTSFVGIAVVLSYLHPAVHSSLPLLCAITALHGFFASTGGPLLDSLSLQVLKENPSSGENYGDQRVWNTIGWGGMAFIAGALIDRFGVPAMFITYSVLVLVNAAILMKWMPKSSRKDSKDEVVAENKLRDAFRKPEARWLIANLVIYGMLMALLENFLNVYLLQDFRGTTGVLLGMATAVMCAGELPVFKYSDGWMKSRKNGIMKLLVMSEVILAVRCVLYALLPSRTPWLVLLIEPFHGFTFAGTWCATVAYGQKLAPPGTEARMQALLNGLFFQLSFALGSLYWGFIIKPPAQGGLGFRGAFYLDAVACITWIIVWQMGLRKCKPSSMSELLLKA